MTAGQGSASPTGQCPECGQPVWPGDNFCESCRAELSSAEVSGDSPGAAPGCPQCPDAPVGPEGYCESCGRKTPGAGDHSEIDLGLLAGVSDLGRRHPRNEDAMALASTQTLAGPAALAVVCDGVSTSSRPDEAARQAVRAAIRVLLAAARTGQDLAAGSRQAFEAARAALTQLARETGPGATPGPSGSATAVGGDEEPANAPSATFVSAVVTGRAVTVCWLGDSRAYWLDDRGAARQLTTDDSVATELVARGLPQEQAFALPAGHVVTGWLGADLSDAEPHVAEFSPPGPGVVLLCSDGLWNYQGEAAELAVLALPGALADPLASARALVAFANEAGGHDNITVVLAPFPPAAAANPDAATTAQLADPGVLR